MKNSSDSSATQSLAQVNQQLVQAAANLQRSEWYFREMGAWMMADHLRVRCKEILDILDKLGEVRDVSGS